MKNVFYTLLVLFIPFIGFSTAFHERSFTPPDSSMVYDFPEKMAKYPGGAEAMEEYIRENMKYGEDLKEQGVKGRVYVQFVVEKDGAITNVKVRRGSNNSELDKEAVRLVKSMPNWIPGTMRGKKVRVQQTLPIVFAT